MNTLFDTEDSINSDEGIKEIDCKRIVPNFHHEEQDFGISVNKKMNDFNTMSCKFKDGLNAKDECLTQSSPFKSTNIPSSQHMRYQIEKVELQQPQQNQLVQRGEQRKREVRKSIEKIELSSNRAHRNSQPLAQNNPIQVRKPKRQIYVTQIVNQCHQDANSFPFPQPHRLSRIIANDCQRSQQGSQVSTPRGILKSSSIENLRIGSRLSMQSLNSPMRPSQKRVSFEFTSEQIKKLRTRSKAETFKYQRLKTKFHNNNQ